MVSPNPVPSRAALHALRGLVFTTSCSVIFLAEERRRRTKVARTAIENARKLHTVKARRQSVAMLDTRLSEPELELLTIGRATDAPRRRRRQRSSSDQPWRSKRESSDSTELSQPLNVAQTESTAASAYAPGSPPAVEDAPTHRLRSDDLDAPRATTDRKPSPFEISSLDLLRNTSSLHRSLLMERASPQAQDAMKATIHESTDELLEALKSDEPSDLNLASMAALDYIATSSPRYAEARKILGQLLKDMELPGVTAAVARSKEDLAFEVVRKVISTKPEMTGSVDTRRLRSRCLSLLKTVIKRDLERVDEALDAVVPLFKNGPQLMVPLLPWLAEGENCDGAHRVLQYFVNCQQADFKLDSVFVWELMAGYAKRYKDSHGAYRAFQLLQDAGLSKYLTLDPGTTYDIHQLLLSLASNELNMTMCLAEAERLHELNADRAKTDNLVQLTSLLADVVAGRFDTIQPVMEKLDEFSGSKSRHYLPVISKLLDVYAQRLSPDAFEQVVRTFVDKYGVALKEKWVQVVLDHYSAHVNRQPMISWLQFCSREGYPVDNDFLQKFYPKLHRHWMAGDEELSELYEVLRYVNPNLQLPRAMKDNKSAKAKGHARQLLWNHEGWEHLYIRSAANLVHGTKTHDWELFDTMQAKALLGSWETVWAAYEERLATDLPFSLRCLRLAVLARLKLDNGATERTSRLVWETHSRGHNISEALTPLLMAQIAEGKDACALIHDVLSKGARIHDMVYNRAAQSASATGDQRAAIKICETAASKNGKGDLLYSPYNFVNLLFAYVGEAFYPSLESLLLRFTSERRWWSSDRLCKRSLKLAMKTVAKRAAVASDKHHARPHEEALNKLNEAFLYGFENRLCAADRMAMMDDLTVVCESDLGRSQLPTRTESNGVLHPGATSEGNMRRKAPTSHVRVKPRAMVSRTGSASGTKATHRVDLHSERASVAML